MLFAECEERFRTRPSAQKGREKRKEKRVFCRVEVRGGAGLIVSEVNEKP